ncbi:acyltransferase family protein [Nostoc sp.]|uniref:acyltransferase family protein n=1 Tax=Nostoc sp. TaxID=1180 RepID=UPI003FA56C2A
MKNLSSGVEVFFVISGFVIAYTLRNTTINFQSASNFFIRRILKLAPPYWLALILSMLIAGVSNIFIRVVYKINSFLQVFNNLTEIY